MAESSDPEATAVALNDPALSASTDSAIDNTNSDVVTSPTIASAIPIPPTPAEERNQAPGIPDRRKSVRPTKEDRSRGRGKGRGGNKSATPSIKVSMADMGSEMKVHDGDETPGERSDTFEDAIDQPTNGDLESAADGHMDNAEENQQEDVIREAQGKENDDGTPRMSARMSGRGNDDMMLQNNEDAPIVPNPHQPSLEAAPHIVEGPKVVSEHSQPIPTPVAAQSKRLSQGLMSPPTMHSHTRQRSVSPGRFPINVRDTSNARSPSPGDINSGGQSPVKGLSGDIPAVNFPPPPSTTERAANIPLSPPPTTTSHPPPPGGLARKASSGFGALLGRMNSIRRTARSPPGPRLERRTTASTIATTDSAAGPGLTAIADGPEGDSAKARPSLQDRFQNLRRQEEQHGQNLDGHKENDDLESTPVARKHSEADVLTSPTQAKPELRMGRAASTPGFPQSPPTDSRLPPGTISGVATGPSEQPKSVDWNLWQALVYEGPTAVARTSGAELSQAIASGIPGPIRGVVWQVLADSKSEDLEAMYRTLKARGAESDPKAPPMNRTESSMSQVGTGEKESTSSSRSSVHSESSTPATSAMTTPPASVDGQNAEIHTKLLAEKQKREAAALQRLEKAIKRDMGSRTSYSKYAQAAGLQDGLFGVCKAYALFDEAVGYAQGINFIAMPLLFNMSEEETFAVLVRLMHKYNLRSLFEPEMPGLHLRLYQFERLLEEHEPALYCHLRRRNVGPQLYATQWFLTLFAYRFPLQLVLRVYDLVFSEGLTAILKLGIVLMQRNREALLGMKDMGQLTTFLKEKIFDVYIDKSPSAASLLDSGFFGSVSGGADKELYRADELVRDACSIQISEETLQVYSVEWEEKHRIDKERDTEFDNLRSMNTSLLARVKALEERVQVHDIEHVNIASELVKVKVENEGLQDENEGLKFQVEELRRVVDSQPAEVEEKLKSEMDRIMQRNIEVQNENRAVKEEMDEMEHELVNVKMMHAETQSDHDILKQRWASVQAMLNGKS